MEAAIRKCCRSRERSYFMKKGKKILAGILCAGMVLQAGLTDIWAGQVIEKSETEEVCGSIQNADAPVLNTYPVYYTQSDGTTTLLFQLESEYDYAEEYLEPQFLFYVDGEILENDYGYYQSECSVKTTIAAGTHKVYAQVVYRGEVLAKTAETEFQVEKKDILALEGPYVIQSGEESPYSDIEVLNFSGKDIVKASVEKGNTCIGTTTESRPEGEFSYGDIYKDFYMDHGYKSLGYRLYVDFDYTNYLYPPVGNYDLKVTFEDGTTEVVKDLVTVTDKGYVSSIYGAYGYDNLSDYMYIQLYGVSFDPSRFDYTVKDQNKQVLSTSYVSCKKNYLGSVVKLKRNGWKAGDCYVSISPKPGSNLLVTAKEQSLYPSSGIYYAAYNPAKKQIETAVSGDNRNGQATCEIISGQNSDTVLASAKAEMKDGFASFSPKCADGSDYVIPANQNVTIRVTLGKSKWMESIWCRGWGTGNSQSDNAYLSASSYVTAGEDYSFYYYTDKTKTQLGNAKYTFELYSGSTKLNASISSGQQEVYYDSQEVKKVLYTGKFGTGSLAGGVYTLKVLCNGTVADSRNFRVIPSDKFVITDDYIGLNWNSDKELFLNFITNRHGTEDAYNVELFRTDGTKVNNVSYTVAERTQNSYWVSLKINGISYQDSAKKYYVRLTHKTLGAPVDPDGNTFYNNTLGSLERVSTPNNYGSFNTNREGRVKQLEMTGWTFPVTIHVYCPYDTDAVASVTISEKDCYRYYKDSPDLCYGLSGITAKLPDADALYDLVAVDSCGNETCVTDVNLAGACTKHDWSEWNTIESASCTKAGTRQYICNVCGATRTETVSATGKHDYGKNPKITTHKATTSKDGYTSKKCLVCKKDVKVSTIYRIKTVSLSKTSYTYNGRNQKPGVTVKDAKGKTISSKYYTVSYPKSCKSVGTYTVTIQFKGNYSGTVKKTYTIVPKGTSISKLTAVSKGFSVKWSKQTSQTSGYQIQYSTSSKFSKPKYVTVSKTSTVSSTVRKLSGKKKYYVRVRTYKTIKGKKYYSSWSKAKSVTTKK